MAVGDIIKGFHVKSYIFTPNSKTDDIEEMCANAKEKAINAFELMMAGGRGFPSQKSGRH
ncbi:hypothetical protein FSP39_024313 [Pinctada imbricata]|uniref:Uncharacterized protein n=1 Tax=Pinctada imbricata TaxID=66713 RepID=A0AA88YFK8_PINIB|nr:hypothetical protein FSP39_002624 [Pinctada imbricata]KAK3100397.1 hypothetical protein FSP39_019261 [Pinctada imbricata]KAK3100726.1 hypothetical protein FSP39_024313 [Pinctada imbricata]